ncbi:hypothetical protein V495_05678 [Pseudogymnoascus sp. VKM F-4514 (FW-929)]|nr:hypothetical protein V490_07323 [Pseudogymnoascus sp. VKM F-3557]KFY39954.1 hypothetical protein V495_05678 [Pseudogymnoascus sp. VKM F-4514 (FW-929)]KFY58192.1 hypothetical protein V497_04987 [Pseudogymnoascus sp. VKM F-4516 (FW-969)]
MEAKNPPTGIAASAQAYQLAMSQQQPAPAEAQTPDISANPPQPEAAKDVTMADESAESPAPVLGKTPNAQSPIPARTGTPVANIAADSSSRAASQHPEQGPTAMPAHAPPHGAPARQYLNAKVTATLLEGMKQLAKEQPSDPLRVLGEFLIQKSKEIEGN